MKKMFLVLLLCLFGCRCPCDSAAQWYADDGRIKVLSTTAMIDDLVKAIGAEEVDHLTLIGVGIDPHSYELVKGDDEKIREANLLVGNGLNLEHGASLQFQLMEHPNTLLLAEAIQKKVPERILYTDEELDPHIWMDVSLWAEGVDSIAQRLGELDPEHAALFAQRGDALKKEMLIFHCEVKDELEAIPENLRFLVTSHDAFHYFARAYLGDDDLRCVAPEGLAPEGRLAGSDLKRVIEHLCSHRIGVVFPESNVSQAALKKIVSSCSANGLDVRISSEALYGDSMGLPGSGADTYLGMIRHNATVLKGEWSYE